MDVEKIKKRALQQQKTFRGRLKLWHSLKYGKINPKRFEDRTIGGLLREYYEDAAFELERLRGQLSEGYSPEIEVKITELEQLFSDSKVDLQSLDADESLDNYQKARKTGDPLADKWERQIAAGETPDLEEDTA